MNDPGATYDYPAAVRFQIPEETIDGYADAADFLNTERFDVVSLQHEYGIFGDEAGGHIVELLNRLSMPIVTTLHTVLPAPTPVQHKVMGKIIARSTKLVVMAEKGRELLRSVHEVSPQKIEVIPHGIPDFPFLEAHHAKANFGFSGKTVILTFGLLSPSKGIETVIDAMPGIVECCPNAVYVILGATHPNLIRHQGEAYREGLITRVQELGMQDQVVFFNQFVDQATLLDFISILRELGLSRQKARPSHPEKDPAAQAAFKRAPVLLRKIQLRIKTSASVCSSRTRRGSARRVGPAISGGGLRPAGMTRARSACRPTSRSWPCRPIRLSSIPSSAYGSNLKERFLSHRLHDDYEAIVDAACKAWRRLTAQAGRIKSLCTYPWIPKVKT